MKVNYNWLSLWVDINLSPDQLANLLNHLGIEVENIELTSNDAIFTLDITPNRPDLLSIQGISREIAAKTDKNLKKVINYQIPEGVRQDKEIELSVTIESVPDCARYVASLIDGIEIGPSPTFISERLEKCGIRSINNVIDITNYVLLEIGQPLHAFDYDRIGNKIIVRRAKNGETIVTLEEEEKVLSNLDLVIADNRKPIAIAGVIGGESSGITEKTKTIVLESAFFKPELIRKTSRRLKLSTESSYRFERKADIGILRTASLYALHLLLKYAKGKSVCSIIDTNTNPELMREVPFSFEKTNRLLGKRVEKEEVNAIFNKLGFRSNGDDTNPKIEIPSYRRDIEIEEDLTEEIGRFIGYDNIPSRFGYSNEHPIIKEERDILPIKRIMTSLGFSEAMNIPFIEPSWVKREGENPIELKNPMWSDKNILRVTLLPGLISNVKRNLNRGEESVALFEVGKVFTREREEEEMVAGILAGNMPINWYESQRPADFYDIKGTIEVLLKELNIGGYQFSECKDPFYITERALSLNLDKSTIGCFGLLCQDICKADIFGFEFNLHKLLSSPKGKIQYLRTYRFPPIKRDLSIVVDEKTPYDRVKNIINSIITHDVKIELIDVYKDPKIGNNKKSLTIRLELYHPAKTLTEEEIKKDMENVIKGLSKLGADLRK